MAAKNVMIIDASAEARQEASSVFTRLGHKAEGASNGDEAWTLISDGMPDILLVGDWVGGKLDRKKFAERVQGIHRGRPKLVDWFDEDKLFDEPPKGEGLHMQVARMPSRPTEGFDALLMKPLDTVEVVLRGEELGLK